MRWIVIITAAILAAAMVAIAVFCTVAKADSADISASFETNVTGGTVPLTVQFTDTSSGSITGYAWSFGDGSSNVTVADPLYTYTKSGTYTVMLTVTDGTNTSTATGLITVDVVAGFTANVTSGQAQLCVQFTDASYGSITGYAWSFGDGSANVTDENPVHTYTMPGTYTVMLTVTDSVTTDTETGTITVANNASATLLVSFTANVTSGTAPLTLQLNDTSTGDITGWVWYFGDGSDYQTTQNVTHTYSASGSYTVTLIIRNSTSYNTTTGTITVTDADSGSAEKLAVSFTRSPTYGTAPLTVYFYDLSSGDIEGWYWNFGDGNYSSAQNSSHTYTTAGTYTVMLTITNSTSYNSTNSTVVVYTTATVTSVPLAAGFSANVTGGTAPLTVQFTDTSTGSPTAWLWDFGDGSETSTEQNPTHTFESAGIYTVKLTVSGSSSTVSSTMLITVDGAQAVALASAANATNDTTATDAAGLDNSQILLMAGGIGVTFVVIGVLILLYLRFR